MLHFYLPSPLKMRGRKGSVAVWRGMGVSLTCVLAGADSGRVDWDICPWLVERFEAERPIFSGPGWPSKLGEASKGSFLLSTNVEAPGSNSRLSSPSRALGTERRDASPSSTAPAQNLETPVPYLAIQWHRLSYCDSFTGKVCVSCHTIEALI